MPSYVPCKKNDTNGYIFYVSLVSQANTKIFQANPTYAAGDIQVAVDDVAPANVSAVEIDADFTKRVKITLSQAQTNGDNLTVICSDVAGAEWCDLTINIQTSAQTLDEIDTVLDTAAADVANIDGAAMRGTNNAALEAAWTAALAGALGNYTAVRAGYLDELAAANIPADVDTLLTRITEALTLAAIADAVWDELIAGHLAAGSTGAALNAAGAAGDPWGIALPGVYADGTAGERLTTLSEKSTFNLS